jgi:KaiC/GvpD/RAD55 family RecA-like ATPase
LGLSSDKRKAISDSLYKQLEAAYDGIVDFKLEDMGKGTRTVMRIRNMRDVAFDSQWHPLKIAEYFKVTFD